MTMNQGKNGRTFNTTNNFKFKIMKKILVMASSFLFFTGLKAQTPSTIIKKETQKQPIIEPEAFIKLSDSNKTNSTNKPQPLPTKIGHDGIKRVTTSHIKSPAPKP